MVDFYGLPRLGDGAWPGRESAVGADTHRKASLVEAALARDLARTAGRQIDPARFIPFVVVHEFEGLLFSDCTAFARGIGRTDLEPQFRRIRDAFATPEDINDSPDTCPSKRVTDLVPGYEKPLFGTLAALEIGLTRIRAACPHFEEWLQKLESQIHP